MKRFASRPAAMSLIAVAIALSVVVSEPLATASSVTSFPAVVQAIQLPPTPKTASPVAVGTVQSVASLQTFAFGSKEDGFALGGGQNATLPVSTSDGGKTWRVAGPDFWNPDTASWTYVGNILAGQNGTAVAFGGPGGGAAVDVTTDSGRQWWVARLGSATPAAAVVGNDIFVLASPTTSNSPMALYESVNGGRTWTHRSNLPDISGALAELSWPTPKVGYALVTGTILAQSGIATTTNGGQSWVKESDPCITEFQPATSLNDQFGAASASSLWLLCGAPAKSTDGPAAAVLDRVERSSNGGATWTAAAVWNKRNSPFPSDGRLGGTGAQGYTYFASSTNAWFVYSPEGPVETTTNGGRSWRGVLPKTIQSDYPREVFSDGGADLFVATEHALWRLSADQWEQVATGQPPAQQ
jgi:hypothetical protein